MTMFLKLKKKSSIKTEYGFWSREKGIVATGPQGFRKDDVNLKKGKHGDSELCISIP